MPSTSWFVRGYRPGDEAALVAAWNASLPFDPLDAGTLCARVLADANFDPDGLLVADAPDGDGLAGFALAVRRRVPLGPAADPEEGTGWVTAFGVRPEHRRAGLGSALLEAACAFLGRHGCRRVEVSPYAPGYFWPGVDRLTYPSAVEFLRARGFSVLYEAVAMSRALVGYCPPPDAAAARRRLEGEGVTFRSLAPPDVVPLIEWTRRTFHEDWARAVREAVARRLPWGRTLVAVQDGRPPWQSLLGFAQYGCYDRSLDRFGPFGVDPAARGRGIGKVLLHETLRRMQQDDLRCAWFLWTAERSPAGELYRRAGFEVTRRFVLLRRELGS